MSWTGAGPTLVLLLNESDIPTPGAGALVLRGPHFVGDAISVGIQIQKQTNTGERLFVQLEWFADRRCTQPIDADTFSMDSAPGGAGPAGTFLSCRVVAAGPYVRARIASFNPTGGTFFLRLWTSSAVGNTQDTPNLSILFSNQGVLVGAGATLSFNIPNLWIGEASLFWGTNATAFRIQLVSLDYLSNQRIITVLDSAMGAPKSRDTQLFLPPIPMRFDFTNNDAGNRNFEAALHGRPFFAGS